MPSAQNWELGRRQVKKSLMLAAYGASFPETSQKVKRHRLTGKMEDHNVCTRSYARDVLSVQDACFGGMVRNGAANTASA